MKLKRWLGPAGLGMLLGSTSAIPIAATDELPILRASLVRAAATTLGAPELLTAPTAMSFEEDRELRTIARTEALLALGQVGAAHRLMLGLDPHTLETEAATRARAWTLLAAGDFAPLLSWLDAATADHPELGLVRAAALLRSGNASEAAPLLRTLWIAEAHSIFGLAALRELAALDEQTRTGLGTADTQLLLELVPPATIALAPNHGSEAPALVRELARRARRNGELAIELLYAQGMTALHAERVDEAVSVLARCMARAADAHLRRAAELALAEAHRRRGNYGSAMRHFDAVVHGADDTLAHQAMAAAGQMAVEYRRYDQARVRFEQQLVANPVGDARSDALWGLGWVAFRQGDFASAQRFFDALGAEAPHGERAPQVAYWTARTHEERGALPEARQAMLELVAAFPLDYYAHRAEEWLRVATPATSPRARVGAADPAVTELTRLLDAGLHRHAGQRLKEIASQLERLGRDDLDTVVLAATTLREERLERRARLVRHLRFPDHEDSRAVLSALFPARFVELIRRHAPRQHVPPALAAALVRQESAFNPRAVSSVGALGLMQLLPTTALELLREDERVDLQTLTERLKDPELNVRLGARYLGRMLRAFDGRFEYALAAYNAGPGTVTRWREARGEMPADLFVEEIPYAETRAYVRRVISGMRAYRFSSDAAPDARIALSDRR